MCLPLSPPTLAYEEVRVRHEGDEMEKGIEGWVVTGMYCLVQCKCYVDNIFCFILGHDYL